METKPKRALPGEKLAVIEEFEAGEGAYPDGATVRSQHTGDPTYDWKQRVIRVKPRKTVSKIPKPGDTVMGQVESAQSNVINLRIRYVNGRVNEGRFTGMLMVRDDFPRRGRGGPRRTTICKPGDILRAKVISDTNAIIHLSVDRSEDGVVYTICSICGGPVKRVDGTVKCVECGNVEDRKLASDFARAVV